MDSLLRHIRACNNAVLPGGRLPFFTAGQQVGWVEPALAERLLASGAVRRDAGIEVAAPALPGLARALAEAGAFPWRAEAFDVRATFEGPVLAQLDRGACPAFGVIEAGVHVNGLVESEGETKLWVARRAAHKSLDPGKLDHIVGGGIPAGLGPREALLKEAAEEAGLSPELVAGATQVGTVRYAMARPEGLRRDCLYCYDLPLPPDFVPVPQDGEVEAFELWNLPRALDTVRHTDAFKFNVNLVLIDLFLRRGLVAGDEARVLRAALVE